MSNRATTSSDTSSGAFWCESAWLPDGVAQHVRFEVENGRFVHFGLAPEPLPDDRILRGMTLPGAVNGHSHTFHRALRGAGAAGDTFWTWRDTMYRVAQRLDPDRYRRFARAVYAEMLSAGYTTVVEFHYVHHRVDGSGYPEPNAMGIALRDAAAEAGIRLTLVDTCYLSSGFGAPVTAEQRRFFDGSARQWCQRVSQLEETGLFRVGAAIHSVRAVDQAAMTQVAEWASTHRAPLHVHLSEQEAENTACLAATGLSPTGLLARAGVWGKLTTGVHGVRLSPADMEILGQAGATVCLCPSTEADLGDGIAPAVQLSQRGVPLAIGSDENVQIDPFAEVRAVEMSQRLVGHTRENFGPRALVDMMSRNGARCAGWPDGGVLAPGALADWVVVACPASSNAGAIPERVPLLATAADVREVFVAGRQVVDDGSCLAIDAVAELAELSHVLREVG